MDCSAFRAAIGESLSFVKHISFLDREEGPLGWIKADDCRSGGVPWPECVAEAFALTRREGLESKVEK